MAEGNAGAEGNPKPNISAMEEGKPGTEGNPESNLPAMEEGKPGTNGNPETEESTVRRRLMDGDETLDEISVLVKFTTKQEQYAVPGSSVSIKASSTSVQLNEIVKAFLEQSTGEEKEVPQFEFVVHGQLLVRKLGVRLLEANVSLEQVVEIEYMEKLPPPTPKDSLQHDDWVAALDCSPEWLVTGCYDNTVHLWEVAGLAAGKGDRAHKLTIPAHKAPVKAVTWVNTNGPTKTFISTSIDQTAVVWVWHSGSNAVECVSECRGHTQSVECVAVDDKGELFATGSWDNTLKIWSMSDKKGGDEGVEEESERKKRRATKKPLKKTPLITMAGHSENIGGVVWSGRQEVTTASWDHTIRVWDTDIGGIKSQILGNCAFFSLSWSPLNRSILASSADRHIRLYDPRQTGGSVVKQKFTSHNKWVSSVQWSKTRDHLFISGGYDNVVKMWDSRSPKTPLYDLKGHEDKVLGVVWSNPSYIISGSADCTAKVFSSNDYPAL